MAHNSRYASVVDVQRNSLSGLSDVRATRGVEIVYYLRLPDGLIKIGTSRQPLERLARHRREKFASEVLAVEFGGRELERERHLQFADERDGYVEHFTPSNRLMAHINELRQALNLSS